MDEHQFVWIASYPKSGNTWIRTLLREYFRALNPNQLPFETSDMVPYFYNTVSPYPINELGLREFAQLRPAAMMHMMALHRSRPQSAPVTFVKSEMISGEMHGIPFFSPLWVDKVIYIHRDPRDIIPSLADHTGETLEEIVGFMGRRTAVMGEVPRIPTPVGTWSQHVDSWLHTDRVPVHVTSYEEMHEDTERELDSVLRFMDFKPDTEAVERAVEVSSFSKLQKVEEKDGFVGSTERGKKFFRRGIIGSYKDEVPGDLLQRLEKDHRRLMEELGYA